MLSTSAHDTCEKPDNGIKKALYDLRSFLMSQPDTFTLVVKFAILQGEFPPMERESCLNVYRLDRDHRHDTERIC